MQNAFLEHIDEMGEAGFKYEVEKPWIGFYQNTTACIGPDATIVYPQHLTCEVDYELEICAVIKGVRHKDLTPEDAEKAIGGYLIFNDVTARDIQATEFPNRSCGYSKALDTFCPIGPCIVPRFLWSSIISSAPSLAAPFGVPHRPHRRLAPAASTTYSGGF